MDTRSDWHWIIISEFITWGPATLAKWFNITCHTSYRIMESSVWQTVRETGNKRKTANKWGQRKEGDMVGQANKGVGEPKIRGNRCSCAAISLSAGNPAVDNVDEGKRQGLSDFQQNSRLSGWTSKQKKKKKSVTNVNPMHICFFWTPDVPQCRLSSGGAPYEKHYEGLRLREFKSMVQADSLTMPESHRVFSSVRFSFLFLYWMCTATWLTRW